MSRSAHRELGDKEAGFTLIEVLVAISVVTVSLTAIGALTGTAARGVRSLEQHVSLVETARTVAASLPPRSDLAPGSNAGELYGNRWRINVSPYLGTAIPQAADSPWATLFVEIHVQSPSGSALILETVRLRRKHD